MEEEERFSFQCRVQAGIINITLLHQKPCCVYKQKRNDRQLIIALSSQEVTANKCVCLSQFKRFLLMDYRFVKYHISNICVIYSNIY